MTKQFITAADWLAAWDAGETVPSVSMGGISEGYEHAIQVTAAEIIRWLITEKSDAASWRDPEKWERTREKISADMMALPLVQEQGLSGAQWGAAMNLACIFYKRGPAASMADDEIADRIIEIKK